MNKRIAIINHNLGSGGAEKLIYDMALEMKKMDINFSVILLTSVNDIYGEKLKNEGVEVIYLSNKWDIYSPKNIFRLVKILKNYDVIHTHIYAAQLWTAFVSLFLSKKLYITTEHSTFNNRRGKLIFKALDKWMYSRYDKIITITEQVKIELNKWIHFNKSYIVIKNGINLEKYAKSKIKSREEFDLLPTDKIVCQIARFNKVKRHEILIEALKLLPENYKAILIGAGDTQEEIRKLVKKLNLVERVKFLGYREDISELIKMSDICTLTSEYEGLPISAIEGMYLKPFVGTNVPGIKELVENYGLIFEYNNSRELAQKLFKLLENQEKYDYIKNRCKRRAEEFDIKTTVRKYIFVYNGETNEL